MNRHVAFLSATFGLASLASIITGSFLTNDPIVAIRMLISSACIFGAIFYVEPRK